MYLLNKHYGNYLNGRKLHEQLKFALECDQERTLWEIYLVSYQNMDAENFISFEDFKSKLLSTQMTSRKSDDEILDEMLAIVAAHEGRFVSENI